LVPRLLVGVQVPQLDTVEGWLCVGWLLFHVELQEEHIVLLFCQVFRGDVQSSLLAASVYSANTKQRVAGVVL
jgi:hypothetical protein